MGVMKFTGTDVFKALALGAKAVFIGRPALYEPFSLYICNHNKAFVHSSVSFCLYLFTGTDWL